MSPPAPKPKFVDRTSGMRDDLGDMRYLAQHRASGNVSKQTGRTLSPVDSTTGMKVDDLTGKLVPDDEALKQVFLDRGVYVTLKKD